MFKQKIFVHNKKMLMMVIFYVTFWLKFLSTNIDGLFYIYAAQKYFLLMLNIISYLISIEIILKTF